MRAAAALLMLVAGSAAAHPIEPLVTGAPMPVPRDQIDAGATFRSQHGVRELGIDVAGGVGDWGELSAGTEIDLEEGEVGAVEVGAKLLLLMEGPTGIDLALAASVSTARAIEAQLLAGRSIVPGWYLQGRVRVGSTPVPAPVVALARPHGAGGALAEAGGVVSDVAVALQWSPISRLLPTVEAQLAHSFESGDSELMLVPELVFLIDMNHLALKVGAPITIDAEGTSVGVIGGVAWQR